MYYGSLGHDRILEAFRRCVPGTFVKDYRDNMGFITVCRGYRDIKWKDQQSSPNVYRSVPAETLVSIPRGNVTSATHYHGQALHRTGWRLEFRKAMKMLSEYQMRAITKFLGVGEVFPGIC